VIDFTGADFVAVVVAAVVPAVETSLPVDGGVAVAAVALALAPAAVVVVRVARSRNKEQILHLTIDAFARSFAERKNSKAASSMR
jgi:O-acetyl-ADP-ribose deacetylase (regulator of RNase III)